MSAHRLRICLDDTKPHYMRTHAQVPCCHRCRVPFDSLRSDEDLRKMVHAATWQLYAWKTLLCLSCSATKTELQRQMKRYCISCLDAECELLEFVTKNNKTVPLCVLCARLCDNQLRRITTYTARFSAAERVIRKRMRAEAETKGDTSLDSVAPVQRKREN